ncbi:hypothetical protein FHX14_005543 [Rhizobium sp. BK619]|nr:hypothetical protein [Rhizobium sp. BK619]
MEVSVSCALIGGTFQARRILQFASAVQHQAPREGDGVSSGPGRLACHGEATLFPLQIDDDLVDDAAEFERSLVLLGRSLSRGSSTSKLSVALLRPGHVLKWALPTQFHSRADVIENEHGRAICSGPAKLSAPCACAPISACGRPCRRARTWARVSPHGVRRRRAVRDIDDNDRILVAGQLVHSVVKNARARPTIRCIPV